MRNQPDEEGFITVMNKKNKPTTRQEEEAGKKPVLENFYRFQQDKTRAHQVGYAQ